MYWIELYELYTELIMIMWLVVRCGLVCEICEFDNVSILIDTDEAVAVAAMVSGDIINATSDINVVETTE